MTKTRAFTPINPLFPSAITPLRGLFTLYSYPCNYDLGDSISTAKPTIGDAVVTYCLCSP